MSVLVLAYLVTLWIMGFGCRDSWENRRLVGWGWCVGFVIGSLVCLAGLIFLIMETAQ